MTTVKLKTDQKNLDRYIGSNENGDEIIIGNDGKSVGPMQSVLLAAAGCSTIDIKMILQKMHQDIQDIAVDIKGTRAAEHPKVYTEIHMHFKIYGPIDEKKAARAIELSLTKYCSVSLMLAKTANITSSFEISLLVD